MTIDIIYKTNKIIIIIINFDIWECSNCARSTRDDCFGTFLIL